MHKKFVALIRMFITIMLSCLLLSACLGGSGGTIRYYLVNPVEFPAVNKEQNRKLVIQIINLHVPQYLEHSQIAVRTGTNSLKFSEFNQWGENLRKNLMQTMARNLSALLASADIATPLNRSSSIPNYRLEIYIDQFEQGSDGLVRLAARWQLIDAAGSEPLGMHSADLKSRDRIPDRNYDQMVGAMRDLYGQLSRMIADNIVQAAGD